jgi:acetyl esterase/lipase
LDLFLDENIEYARKLIKAGVRTEFDIYPAAIHGFPKIEEAQSTKDFIHDYSNSLIKALKLIR